MALSLAEQAAIEIEADRLFGLTIRIRLLAQTLALEFQQAGYEAVRRGLVSAADWEIIREA